MLLVVFVECRHCFAESVVKDVSHASPETINIVPRRRAASKRVSRYRDSSHAPRGSLLITGTPAGADEDFPCNYVNCVCRNVMRKLDIIMLREDMNCVSRWGSTLRILSGIFRCCSNRCSLQSWLQAHRGC